VPLDGLSAQYPGDRHKSDPEKNEEQEGSGKKPAFIRPLALVLIRHASTNTFNRDYYGRSTCNFLAGFIIPFDDAVEDGEGRKAAGKGTGKAAQGRQDVAARPLEGQCPVNRQTYGITSNPLS
jgi:hypothetical protein